jgi:hypothetical protein
MSRITNLVWSFYHYVAWYGFRKGIILWIRVIVASVLNQGGETE